MTQMQWRDAIRRVLHDADEPMHYTDIAQAIIDNEYRTRVGATPAATVSAQLSTKPLIAEVARVERGFYTLASKFNRPGALPQKVELPSDVDAEKATLAEAPDVECMGLINAFGMYWRRDDVDWSGSSTKLLGVELSGSTPVDFGAQAGIYILHDRSRPVYVGRVTSERLAARLWEHTRARLSGRWDRFSWFGIRPVTEDGGLGPAPQNVGVDTLIATLEALMIEGLEPPQNRKQGDGFNALEFIQATDPEWRRRQLLSEVTTALSGER